MAIIQSPLLSTTKLNSFRSSLITHNLALPLVSPLSLSTTSLRPKLTVQFQKIQQRKRSQIWKTYAAPEEVLPSDTAPIETAQEIVSNNVDGSGNIISILLFIALIILSILTIGVIYLGVSDFLEKREKEKFEKEESAKKKKSGKKGRVRTRAGPRGFGQKINDDDDLDD